MIKKKIEKKDRKIKPNGTITKSRDYFKLKSENIGVFKQPPIVRKDSES